jgi:cell surface protein SprA
MGAVTLMQVFVAKAVDHPFDFDNPDPIASPIDTPDLRFPITPVGQIDPAQEQKPTFDLKDPQNYDKQVEYDPETDRFYFTEKVGDQNIKTPIYLDAKEYQELKAKNAETDYWRQRLDALSMFNQKPKLPSLNKEGVFNRLFGGDGITIKPQGNLELSFGGNWQNMKNPALPQRAQSYGIFDFDMQMNVNLVAQIGSKVKLNISQNTLASFGEQNVQKFEYTGKEDEIIQKFEAGTISFPLKSSLLSGPLTLFGLKTQAKFGKLMVTGVLSQQKSQRKSISLQGGGQSQNFEVKVDDYEENRNFLLGQYFYENYDKALSNFPIINSMIVITRVEAWITNRTGATQGVRNMINFMDLGERNPFNANLNNSGVNVPSGYPDNAANTLYKYLQQNPSLRTQGSGNSATLVSIGLDSAQGRDYTIATMRQLSPTEFSFQPQLGYINVNTQVNPDDIIGVAYQYTYNGKTYQVGEFAENFPPDSTSSKTMFLKMVKGVSATPTLPIWNLMMKNVYAIGGSNISKEDFRLNVVYQDPGGGEKRYIPEGPIAGVPLIKLLNLDRLNPQNDPFPDGVFDFVEGITINTQYGKVIFPTLQPFGKTIRSQLGGDAKLEHKYSYQMLYDSTKTIARQFQQNNRFLVKGSYKGASGTGISLGSFNIPQGSVTVTAGGQRLAENVDYQVDYSSGSVKILNQGILASNMPINISYEDNAAFGMMTTQNFWGARFDYFSSNKLTLGGTVMRLTERPYTNNVTYGEDPIKNTVLGLDVNYQSESAWITRMLDKLPIYSTSAPSLLSVTGEVAGIFPGHQDFINYLDGEGSVQIDNFEGANSSIDLRLPAANWNLSSTPSLFPEATDLRGLSSNDNRAKLAWYALEPTLIDGSFNTPANVKSDTGLLSYWRQVLQTDIFPQRSCISGQCGIQTFDLAFYPMLRGPYNFNTSIGAFNSNGTFNNTRSKWGGIQRALDNNTSDFEASNVEYITFWVMDPFIYNNNNQGKLYLNLGNVSEDVLKDSRLSYENGLPYPKNNTQIDETQWGFVPKMQQQITRSFDNDAAARKAQDVGYDGLDDDEERTKYDNFLNRLAAIGLDQAAIDALRNDPASDNFQHFRGTHWDQMSSRKGEAFLRYIDYNNPHGNSPVADLNSNFTTSGTNIPESEDINKDNALNETEAYFEYEIDLQPTTNAVMQVGNNFIVDKKVVNVKQITGVIQQETWYQFKIPIRDYKRKIGGIGDFRSIRFMRMFMTGFSDTTILRFAQLQLDRNQWRRYQFSLTAPGENIPEIDLQNTTFGLTNVSLEQNGSKQPVPYKMPPGVARQQTTGQTSSQILQQDEQSMALQVCGLKDGDARAVFKEQRLDMRQYQFLRMFIHAESVPNQVSLNDGDVEAIIRVGSDFTNNYYEYRIPLKITAPNTNDAELVWPERNRLNLQLTKLTDLKTERNQNNYPSFQPYSKVDDLGNTIVVVGNPNLGEVKNVLLGIANPKKTTATPADNGQRVCAEVWFDELRMAGIDEKPGYAASGQVNIQLADLGNVALGASMHTVGYGNIDQSVNERFRDNFYTYNASTNLNMGKLLPRSVGLQLPVYGAYTQSVSNPKYDPYDKDMLLSEKLDAAVDANQRDSMQKAAQEFSSVTSINLANIRYMGNPEKQSKVTMPWSLKNFDFSYAYNRAFKRSSLIEKDELEDQRFGLGYTYTIKSKPFEPFKRIKSKSKWYALLKDFNINYLPSNFSFRSDLRRIFGETQIRNIDDGAYPIDPTYFKNFTWNRNYTLRWELTKALSFNYNATNMSRIDEPYGRIDTKEKRDTLWSNVLRLGRNTNYSQAFNATYTLPMKKIPILDWTSLTATYGSTYNWTAASLLAYSQGNVIANTQTLQINGEFMFSQLYNKSRHLKAINNRKIKDTKERLKSLVAGGGSEGGISVAPQVDKGMFSGGGKGGENKNDISSNAAADKTKQDEDRRKKQQQLPPRPQRKVIEKQKIPGADTMTKQQLNEVYTALKKAERARFKKEITAWRAKRRSIVPEMSDGIIVAGRLATMLKRVTFNYSEMGGTILPGFMDSTEIMGVNMRSSDNWYGFAFGGQYDRAWFDRQAALQRISRDSIFNGQMQQSYGQDYRINATLEPFPDFRVELSLTQKFSKNYSETFKYDNTLGDYQHYSPYSLGTFNISYVALGTMFSPSNPNELSKLYMDFVNNTATISRRLGVINPYTAGLADANNPNYAKGYNKFSQEVLIPAFLAAYTGKESSTVPLMKSSNTTIKDNPFGNYKPMPNWKFTYNGLTKLPFFNEYFNNFVVNHTYTGSLSVNSFVSSFYFQDVLSVGFPSFIDSNSNNYIPFYQVPNVTITETLGPLIGIESAFKNGLNLGVKFNKNRMVSLSLVDFQVSETKSTELVVSAGARIKGLVLPFTVFGVKRLKNDLNINVAVGYRDDITSNTYLAENINRPTRGQKVITISPTIDYVANENLKVSLFFDRRQSIPVMSNSFPITTTRAGIKLIFMFAQQ